jgi:hypothetical protein
VSSVSPLPLYWLVRGVFPFRLKPVLQIKKKIYLWERSSCNDLKQKMAILQGQCPRVLEWGHAPFAVHYTPQRTVYYPDGMKLEIDMMDLTLVESIRVINRHAEHQFSAFGFSSDWNSSRLAAFQQAVARIGTVQPKRTIIFGPSHHSIQKEILSRFSQELIQQGVHHTKQKRKRVTWGDDLRNQAISTQHTYGGWGLMKEEIIPNRFELAQALAKEEEEEAQVLVHRYRQSSGKGKRIPKKVVVILPRREQESNFLEPNNISYDMTEGQKRQRLLFNKEEEKGISVIDQSLPLLIHDDDDAKLVVGENAFRSSSSFEEEINDFDQWLLQNESVL